ncbi:uncharacterized protein [Haliotis cracherodii]|uniref:uncharacterized protein n=1 Tax=Haliotis cracherodii TaxID=6455 RepID=UPI0039EABE37
MVRVEIVAVGLLMLVATADADLSGWSFWSKFARPWEIFIRNSYDIRKAVNLTDSNSDGIVTLEEIRGDITKLDADGDGRVTRAEFVRYSVEQFGANIAIANNYFDDYDLNADNYLTAEDVDMIAPVMTLLDSNKDEELSSYELMTGLRQRDLAAQKKAECATYYIYRLPPREMKLQKKKCASKKL